MKKLLYGAALVSCSYMVANEDNNTLKLPTHITQFKFAERFDEVGVLGLKHAYDCGTKVVKFKGHDERFLRISYTMHGTEKSVYYRQESNGTLILVGDRALIKFYLAGR